jgi:hypothetical protein
VEEEGKSPQRALIGPSVPRSTRLKGGVCTPVDRAHESTASSRASLQETPTEKIPDSISLRSARGLPSRRWDYGERDRWGFLPGWKRDVRIGSQPEVLILALKRQSDEPMLERVTLRGDWLNGVEGRSSRQALSLRAIFGRHRVNVNARG